MFDLRVVRIDEIGGMMVTFRWRWVSVHLYNQLIAVAQIGLALFLLNDEG